MSKVEYKGRSNSKYSRFDKYETAVLEAILQADFDAPEAEQMEMEQAFYISNLIAERKGTKHKDVAVAKAEFFEHYYPLVGEEDTLYDFDDDVLKNNAVKRKEANVSVWLKHWRRFASAAAVILIFMFFGTVTAYAMGYNPIAAIGRWSEDFFWFEDPPVKENVVVKEDLAVTEEAVATEEAYVTSELAGKLAEYGYPGNVVPKWLPDGYTLESIDVDEYEDYIKFIAATFVKQTNDKTEYLLISYTIYLSDNKKALYEKDNGNVERYEIKDRVYYVMTNLDNRVIAWQNGNFEGYITGKFTIEEAEKIINSIDGE